MKPFRIFLFIFIIFLFFGLLSLVMHDNEFRINKDLIIRIPSLEGLYKPGKEKYADISPVIRFNKTDSTSALAPTKKAPVIHKHDPVQHDYPAQPLDYPGNDKSVLIPFFKALSEIPDSPSGIHILHYGDSQLEGDRITDYLRFRFQQEFGGSGPGLLPIGEEEYRLSMQSDASENWLKYNGIGVIDKTIGKRPIGPLGSFFRYLPLRDSLEIPDKTISAWLRFTRIKRSYGNSQHFTRCRLFYSHNPKPLNVQIIENNDLLKNDTLKAGYFLQVYDHTFDVPPESFTLQFSGSHSPDFYAVSLDSPLGISFDNIPLRGSSGLEFTRMDRSLLQAVFNILNVKLLILEFGVNVIPSAAEDYTYYQSRFYNQLMYLKSINPGLCIIVISVSDASLKNGEAYMSYPNIEKIVAAQKAAALKAGCAFWNLFDAMGGKNSMPSWVFASPPLASTDFIHFNYSGARMVGKMFYSALIGDYNEFVKQGQ